MKEVKLEIKTVEHNGQVLQIGQRYEFSDDGVRWVWDRLEGMNKSKGRPYDAERSHFKHIRVIKTDDNGTITPAPVKLTHEQARIAELEARISKAISLIDDVDAHDYDVIQALKVGV
jgi:hypothetical protein